MVVAQLVNGQFLRVPPSLIKRSKQHFHSLSCGVDVILGTNGFIWLTAKVKEEKSDAPAAMATGDDEESKATETKVCLLLAAGTVLTLCVLVAGAAPAD